MKLVGGERGMGVLVEVGAMGGGSETTSSGKGGKGSNTAGPGGPDSNTTGPGGPEIPLAQMALTHSQLALEALPA